MINPADFTHAPFSGETFTIGVGSSGYAAKAEKDSAISFIGRRTFTTLSENIIDRLNNLGAVEEKNFFNPFIKI